MFICCSHQQLSLSSSGGNGPQCASYTEPRVPIHLGVRVSFSPDFHRCWAQLPTSVRLLMCSSFTTGFTCFTGLLKVSPRTDSNSLLLYSAALLEETTALLGQQANLFPTSFCHLQGLHDKHIYCTRLFCISAKQMAWENWGDIELSWGEPSGKIQGNLIV